MIAEFRTHKAKFPIPGTLMVKSHQKCSCYEPIKEVWGLCAAFVGIAPDAASTIGTYIVHIDLTRIGRTVSWEELSLAVRSSRPS